MTKVPLPTGAMLYLHQGLIALSLAFMLASAFFWFRKNRNVYACYTCMACGFGVWFAFEMIFLN
jgi:hypothetical protein